MRTLPFIMTGTLVLSASMFSHTQAQERKADAAAPTAPAIAEDAATPRKPTIDPAMTKQMEKDFERALQLERQEKKLAEALQLLDKYDGTEAVSDDLRMKILDYQAWGNLASGDFAKAQSALWIWRCPAGGQRI